MNEVLTRVGKKVLYDEDNYGNTALHYAAWCAESLEKTPDSDFPYTNHARLNKNKKEQDESAQKMALFLLKLDESHHLINKQNDGGWTPL